MLLDTGTLLGPYEILVPLGAGAMGEVYRARDTRLARTVAIKVLAAAPTSRIARLEREARAISRVSHRHICALYDVGRQDAIAYLVMEHLEGETLARELERGPLPLARVLAHAVQIADGLDAAHTRGVIHRDVKPSNIMVTRDGIKLLDFGLAKLRDPDRDPNVPASTQIGAMTEEGAVLGTYPYMAPEQLVGGDVDTRADIFAFGVVLYEMATGRRPFEADTRAALVAAVLTFDPPPVSTRCTEAPPVFDRLVARCLAKQPDARWQTARDLVSELRWIAGGDDAPAHDTPASKAEPRPRERRLAWAGLGALGGMVLGALALWGLVVSGVVGRRAPQPQFTQVTFRAGTITAARFAPDGETIIYSASWQGEPHALFTSRRGSAESRPLGITNARLLAVSSAGDVAFLRASQPALSFLRPGAGTLARVSLAGGGPRDVLDGVTAADWIPGTDQLAVARSDGQLEFPIGTKIPRPPAGRILALRVAPDGHRLALVERSPPAGVSIVVLDRTGKTVASSTWTDSGGVTWSPDGRDVWFSATQRYASSALWTMSMSGETSILYRYPEMFLIEDAFRDGRTLMASHARRTGLSCLAPGSATPRELGWLDFSAPEALSADGKTVIFGDRPAGAPGTAYLRKTDGSDAIRLGDGFPEDLSPDGTSVLIGIRTSKPHWGILPTGAGSPMSLPPGPFVALGEANFLPPDGRRIAFAASEKGGPGRIYVQRLDDASTARAISPPGVSTTALATPDGRFVWGVSAGAGHMLYPVDEGTARPLPFLSRGEVPLQWSADGRFLYVHRPSWPPAIDRIDMSRGDRQTWRTVFPTDPVGVDAVVNILITPDGNSYCHDYARLLTNLFTGEDFK